MLLSRLVRRLSPVFLCTMAMSLGTTSIAQAITTVNVNFTWTGGNNGVTATGTFTGVDDVNGVSDGFIRGGTLNGNINEITAFDITFIDSTTSTSVVYNLGQLLGFSPDFNFNYQISTNQILQSGNSFETTGFSIGSNAGYLLDTTAASGIAFTDNLTYNNGAGGTLTATPVPFDSDASAIFVSAGSLFAFHQWRKKRSLVNSKK